MAFVALGVLSAVYFAVTGTVWAVTGEFTRLGGQALSLLGVNTAEWQYFQTIHLEGTPLERTDGWIVIGMLVGALAAALLTGEFKWRKPRLKRRIVQGLVGGLIAGFGARLAMGCNLAAMFTGVPQFSLHAWIFTATTALGTWIGVKIIRLPAWRGKAPLRMATATAPHDSDEPAMRRQRIIGILVTTAMVATVVVYLILGNYQLAIAAAFGAMFGILIQRGQICFTAAFRDLWMSGRGTMGRALVLGLIIATVVTFIVVQMGVEPITQIASVGTFIGGTLFGLGIVLAGGCETGMMYRAMEGQIHYIYVFIGNIIGATVLAYGWDRLGIYDMLMASGAKVNLLELWGPSTALLVSLAVLVLCYVLIVYKEHRFHSKSQASPRMAERTTS